MEYRYGKEVLLHRDLILSRGAMEFADIGRRGSIGLTQIQAQATWISGNQWQPVPQGQFPVLD
jgi:hypothetical protein